MDTFELKQAIREEEEEEKKKKRMMKKVEECSWI